MRTLARVACLLLACAAQAARAATVARDVIPAGAGAQRLDLDALALVQAPSPDLRELRLVDAAGTEVPFLAIEPAPPAERIQQAPQVLALPKTDESSGFEADLGGLLLFDEVRLDGLRAPFMKRYRLDGSGDRTRWTTLVAAGTLFDLPDEGLRSTRVAVDPSPFRFVRVTWDDTSSARLEPPQSVAVRLAPQPWRETVLQEPLEISPLPSEPRVTRLRLALPGDRMPVRALVVQTRRPRVNRLARVLGEPELVGSQVEPVLLGSATLRRATRDGIAAEMLRIPLDRAPGCDALELVIEDGDEAPLPIDRIDAEIGPLPWAWFESADGAPLVATFDAERAAPRYDVEAAREQAMTGATSRARWGEWREVPRAAGAPPRVVGGVAPGGPFDAAGYRARRAVAVGEGLVSLLLDAEVLARSHDLADVRVVTPEGTQVPYVLETRDEPLRVPLPLAEELEGPAAGGAGTRRLRLALPLAGLPACKLALATDARVFDRQVRVVAELPGPDRRSPPRRHELGSARWVAADADREAPPLVMELRSAARPDVVLEIDEGDNAPLPLRQPELLLPHRRLRFVHPGGRLDLWFDAPGVHAPRYDVALLGRRVLAEPARDIELALGPSDDVSARAGAGTPTILLWIILGATLMALAIVLIRLTRRPGV